MMNFAQPGGMPQHPGMHPGPPMPGGLPPHQQTMGGPMQMHPGVSGPHPQQMSQAPMMGMQPGMTVPGGPSAHAMQHLAPNGGQMMQQPNMQAAQMNAQLMSMNPQQRMYLQQRHQMQQRAQAMGMQPQHGQQPNMLNPQHIAQMQASGQLGNLPPHMQQQMANAQLMHQQQAAMAEAARQQQQQQNLAAQQAYAMQQAASQGSHMGHPSSQPGQPNQPPMRPASAMATTGMEARPSPAPTAGPGQGGPQPGPQASQAPNQPNQQAQTSGPSGPQAQNATSQGPSPNQVQTNPQPGQPGQGPQQGQNRPPNPQGMAQMQAAQQAHLLRQQANVQAARQQNGQTLSQAFNFANKLGSFRADASPTANNIAFWSQFVAHHFTDDAIYRMVLKYESDGTPKAFEVHSAGLARYLYTSFQSDIDQIQLVLDGSSEKRLNDTHSVVRADRARMLHWFRDGTQLVWNGVFQVIYNGDKIEHLSFENREHQLYYPRSRLSALCVEATPNQNRSPKMTKKSQGQQRNQAPQEPAFDMRKLPEMPITPFGIHKLLQAQLELAETMNVMIPHITFSRDHPELSVQQSLRSLVEQYQQQANQMATQAVGQQGPQAVQGAFPPGGVQGARNPAMAAMQSPALSNSGLPGAANGATPSPHQSNMAPPMAPSMSQQSHQSGSNTSPGMGQGGGNKRRRSTVQGMKEEEVNGGVAKVKQSPRMASGNKRMKGS